jgi:hypothetical protein
MEIVSNISKQLIQSWWVILITIFAFGFYEQSSGKLTKNITRLKMRAAEIETAIKIAEQDKAGFQLQVASQSDPEWIELLLIKCLGLVPEGYTKIYYTENNK